MENTCSRIDALVSEECEKCLKPALTLLDDDLKNGGTDRPANQVLRIKPDGRVVPLQSSSCFKRLTGIGAASRKAEAMALMVRHAADRLPVTPQVLDQRRSNILAEMWKVRNEKAVESKEQLRNDLLGAMKATKCNWMQEAEMQQFADRALNRLYHAHFALSDGLGVEEDYLTDQCAQPHAAVVEPPLLPRPGAPYHATTASP